MPLDFSAVGSVADTYRWKQVASVIEAAIRDGSIPPRTPVPSETAIMQGAGVGRKTARRAVRDLRERGLLYTVEGLGSFASPDIPPPG